jgi:sec-independent protein translocase protein TatA
MGISVWQLLIVLVIVLLLFGTKRIKNIGGDVGSAIKNFRGAMREGEEAQRGEGEEKKIVQEESSSVIEGEVTAKKNEQA